MNKPQKLREGFVDQPDDPFEHEEEKPVKAVEHKDTPPSPPAPDEDEWPIVIKLKKPIPGEKRGDTITELSLREPSTNDLLKIGGNPCRVDVINPGTPNATGVIVIDDARMFQLIAFLADIHKSFLERLDPRDYATSAYRLRRFFLPQDSIW